jgi:hypothetical protein
MIERRLALDELAQPVEQMLEPQHGADAFVERIFVADHAMQAFAPFARVPVIVPYACSVARVEPQLPQRHDFVMESV